MKTFILLSFLAVAIPFSGKAQYVTIPDDIFRQALIERYPGCFNASQMLDTSCSAIVEQLEFPAGLSIPGTISNWDGFQYFKNLQTADFTFTTCEYLPALPGTLKTLYATSGLYSILALPALPDGLIRLECNYSTSLQSLPPLPPTLKFLACSYCSALQSLPALPASLTYLDCNNNIMSTLPTLPSSLDTLICSFGQLTALPPLPAGLKYLAGDNNELSSLPALPAALKFLNVSHNNISSLPALPATLEELKSDNNQLTALPVLPSTLQTLSVNQNNITVLPVFPASLKVLSFGSNQVSVLPTLPDSLKQLSCYTTLLLSLPATLPAGLTYLSCGDNDLHLIPELPLPLTTLECNNDSLVSLPTLPAGLVSLRCSRNQLTALPPLPLTVSYLNCSYNQIYFLPDLPPALTNLHCEKNNITCMPVLPDPVEFTLIDITMDNSINCIPNAPPTTNLNVEDNLGQSTFYGNTQDYPLCSAINNIHHCDAFPLMTGHVYYDNNNNSMHDANEPYKANANIQLSNGAFTVTNSNGYYQIPADSIGNYNITITPPNYFTAAPLQYNYNFNSYDTLVTGDFALHATTTIDSLNISVLPINWAARPGFAFPYLISYENAGTTTLSPNIVFNYDNTRLDYDSSSNSGVINSSSALSLTEPGFVVGDRKSFIGYFRVKPTAVIGDSIHAYVSIQANAVIAKDSTVAEIRGSYDPNDKSATPKLSPSQVAGGDYIYYSIRFQNTGTDTAFSVVITDTLNSQLQASTLQVINTSHPAKITVKDNVVYFEFINILLPDSNINELKSHGYVSFRIKPQPTVTLNSIIPNYAAIYFDYNSPVITNTALTNIVKPQGPLPLKLISFKVERSTGNKANAFWNTSNEINVQSYNIEMSVDGRNFSNISTEKAKGFQYNDYTKAIAIPNNEILYFRLKMIDVDGRFTYSQVVTLRNDKSQSFSLLNNPVKNELNISIQDDALKNTTAKIYNAEGVLVRAVLLRHDVETVNVSSLPAGNYYLVTIKGTSNFIIVN